MNFLYIVAFALKREKNENFGFKFQNLFGLKYRKVAISRPVYYSIFDHFWVATNQDVLLSEMCYYVQQSINWWVPEYRILKNSDQIFLNLYLWKCICTPLVFKNGANHGKWEFIHNIYHVIHKDWRILHSGRLWNLIWPISIG